MADSKKKNGRKRISIGLLILYAQRPQRRRTATAHKKINKFAFYLCRESSRRGTAGAHYIYIYIYICIYVYIYMYKYMYISTYIHIHIHIYLYINIYIYIHTHPHTHTHTTVKGLLFIYAERGRGVELPVHVKKKLKKNMVKVNVRCLPNNLYMRAYV